MISHHFKQGSPEWHAYRRSGVFNASDAAAMLGLDTRLSREALLDWYAGGPSPEFSAWVQANILDRGHEYEAAGRLIAEDIIGEMLYPVVVEEIVDGMRLSASLDGATADMKILFEHKGLNQVLVDALRAGIIPYARRPQLEQQLMCCRAAHSVMFMASNGDPDQELHMWYSSDPDLRDRIVEGWKQFAIDLEARKSGPPPAVVPLPAIAITIQGAISVQSSLEIFSGRLRSFVAGMDLAPATDQGWDHLKLGAEVLRVAVAELDRQEAAALASVAGVAELRAAVAVIREIARQAALAAEKAVDAEKAARKCRIIDQAQARIESYLAEAGLSGIQVRSRLEAACRGRKTERGYLEAMDKAEAEIRVQSQEPAREAEEVELTFRLSDLRKRFIVAMRDSQLEDRAEEVWARLLMD